MEEENNLISIACLDQKIYLFQKNLGNNYVTVFYNSGSTLISQPLFETCISPARIAVKDTNYDGYLEMAVIGNGVADFFRLSDVTNITSWYPLNSDQLACSCLENFATTIFLKIPEPKSPPPKILPPLIFATVIMGIAMCYVPIKSCCIRWIKKC